MATPLPSGIKHAHWGVGIELPAPYAGCVVTDCSETDEAQHQYEYDQQGSVVGDVVYDRHYTFTCTVQVPKEVAHPQSGTVLTIGEKTYTVLNVTTIQNNQSYRKVQLTLERWTNDVTPTDVTAAGS